MRTVYLSLTNEMTGGAYAHSAAHASAGWYPVSLYLRKCNVYLSTRNTLIDKLRFQIYLSSVRFPLKCIMYITNCIEHLTVISKQTIIQSELRYNQIIDIIL